MNQHEYTVRRTSDLIPYVSNSRTHSQDQISQVAASIKEFGFTNPVLIDDQCGIIAGHGRVMAAKKLGIEEVPCIVLVGLTDAQKKAYVIADNQLALNAGWDLDMLKLEIDSLIEIDFDVSLLGFDDDFISELGFERDEEEHHGADNPYTANIAAPTYEPKNEKPEVSTLVSKIKTDELVEKIKRSGVSGEEKEFLLDAAERHTVFDFGKIADYYAHSGEEMQELMEQSALVIIDYNKALEQGLIQISKAITEQYQEENPDA